MKIKEFIKRSDALREKQTLARARYAELAIELNKTYDLIYSCMGHGSKLLIDSYQLREKTFKTIVESRALSRKLKGNWSV